MKLFNHAVNSLLLIVCCFLSNNGLLFAQTDGYLERGSAQAMTSRDIYEREVLIEVQIWGQVNKPGRYRVPVTTDVVGLISYAGGPTEDAALSRVKLVRGGFGQGQTSKINVSKYSNKADKSIIPMLDQGDVVIVPTTFFHKIMRMTGFLSQAAVLVTAYLVVAGVR